MPPFITESERDDAVTSSKRRDGPFQPTTTDVDGWRCLALELDDSGAGYKSLLKVVSVGREDARRLLESIARSSKGHEVAQLRLRAASLLVRDLLALGWDIRSDGHWILCGRLRQPV